MQSYALILFGRVFSGLFGFSMGIAKAYIADITTETERAAYIGQLGVFYGVAFISGPVIAIGIMFVARATGASQLTQWASVFFVPAGLGVCAFVLAVFTLRESKADMQGSICATHNASSNDKCADVNTDKEKLKYAQDNPKPADQRRTNKLVLCLLFLSSFAVTYSVAVLHSMYALLIQVSE